MNKNLLIFLLCLIVLSILILWGTVQFTNPTSLFLIVAVLALATLVAYFFMERSMAQNFIRNYLLTIVIKLLAGGIFIAIIIFSDIDGADANAITFMVAYLLFTALEAGFLFRKFNQVK